MSVKISSQYHPNLVSVVNAANLATAGSKHANSEEVKAFANSLLVAITLGDNLPTTLSKPASAALLNMLSVAAGRSSDAWLGWNPLCFEVEGKTGMSLFEAMLSDANMDKSVKLQLCKLALMGKPKQTQEVKNYLTDNPKYAGLFNDSELSQLGLKPSETVVQQRQAIKAQTMLSKENEQLKAQIAAQDAKLAAIMAKLGIEEDTPVKPAKTTGKGKKAQQETAMSVAMDKANKPTA